MKIFKNIVYLSTLQELLTVAINVEGIAIWDNYNRCQIMCYPKIVLRNIFYLINRNGFIFIKTIFIHTW